MTQFFSARQRTNMFFVEIKQGRTKKKKYFRFRVFGVGLDYWFAVLAVRCNDFFSTLSSISRLTNMFMLGKMLCKKFISLFRLNLMFTTHKCNKCANIIRHKWESRGCDFIHFSFSNDISCIICWNRDIFTLLLTFKFNIMQ